MDLIKTENLKRNYGNTEVLRGISLTAMEGEFLGIMGESGSGKTTLLKILGMIDRPTGGELIYRGRPESELRGWESARIRREEISFVFQEFFLMDSLDILENVMLPLFVSKSADSRREEKARALMKRFGIAELEKRCRMNCRPESVSELYAEL